MNYAIDSTVAVMFLLETKRKYGVRTAISEVSAKNSPLFDKRATVSVDIFGIY